MHINDGFVHYTHIELEDIPILITVVFGISWNGTQLFTIAT